MVRVTWTLCLFCCLWCILSLFVKLTRTQIYNPEYSEKVNVRVSEVLKKSHQPVDRSWAPPNSQEYAQVNMRIMGKPIDPTILNNLRPDVSIAKQRKLRKILGDEFDHEWTSIELPRVSKHPRGSLLPSDPKLALEVRALNMTFKDGSGAVYLLPTHLSEMFQTWLLDQATCAMDFLWEDLGPLFWPRWIRRGVCLNTLRHSCSWPPGMKCRSSGSRALKLLHWKCSQAQSQPNRKRKRANRAHLDDSEKRRRRRRNQRRRRRGKGGGGEEQRKRRTRRLIKKLSLTTSGYHCQWQVQKYLISDKCTCSCT